MAVLGNKPPARITINEMTTVASVWTHNQFLDGSALSGPPLSLGIAAGNVPNFVDLQTGGYGSMIQSDLNSSQTPTMANFATLSSVLAGCVSRIKADACESLFAAATGRDGKVPANTLAAAHSIARDAGYRPERIFALLDAFYPVPNGKKLRSIPYLPYLSVAPSAWILPLKFAGGGYIGGAKVLFDSQGNAWSGANFIVGSQGGDALWDGNLAKFSPNGKPLSPMTTGFAGGGLRVCRRRPAWPRLRHGHRRKRPRLDYQHQRQDRVAVRQEWQAAVAARGLQLRWQAQHHAGHHRRPQRRRMGGGLR